MLGGDEKPKCPVLSQRALTGAQMFNGQKSEEQLLPPASALGHGHGHGQGLPVPPLVRKVPV